jgi:endogenous inhibitor of DNA gyrase (YacG/DUF329 family)
MPITVPCAGCGKPVTVKPYKILLQHSVSCSRECAYAVRHGRPVLARQRRVELTCAFCGKNFIETKAHARDRRFCSRACEAEYQKTALRGENNPYYGKSHSDETRALISKKHFRRYGKDNPNWQGGITELRLLVRKSKKYKQWRDSVYERDNYQSRISGRTGRLAVHHVRSFEEIIKDFLGLHPKLDPNLAGDRVELFKLALEHRPLWDLDNGITMLREEHLALHQNQGMDEDE